MTLKDKLKTAVREMFVARPEDNNDLVWKAPPGGLFGAVVTVRADEQAVLARDGQPAGILAPGRHVVTPDVPALLRLVGDGARATLSALRATQCLDVSLNATLGGLLDAPTGAALDCRCVAEASVEVRDAERLIRAYVGSGAYKTQPVLATWLEEALLLALRAEVESRVRASRSALSDVVSDPEKIKAAVVERSASLDAIGLRVRAFTRLELALDDDSLARLEVIRRAVPSAR